MKDNEIKKAFEWHLSKGHSCGECAYRASKIAGSSCVGYLMTDALDLINRQQAEIERLKAESNMADGYEDALVEMTKSEAVKEFAERFKKKYEKPFFYLGSYEQFMREVDNLVKEMTEQSTGYGSSKTEQ